MKIRFTRNPDEAEDVAYPDLPEWVVPNVVRVVFEGVRTESWAHPVIGCHEDGELYIPVRWGCETVVLMSMGGNTEVSIQARKES